MNLFSWKKKKQPDTPTARTVSVLMQNGSVEEYPEHFIITDGKNCVVCNSKLYHTNLDCKYLQVEMSSKDQVKAMNIHDAERHGFTYCYDCQIANELNENF